MNKIKYFSEDTSIYYDIEQQIKHQLLICFRILIARICVHNFSWRIMAGQLYCTALSACSIKSSIESQVRTIQPRQIVHVHANEPRRLTSRPTHIEPRKLNIRTPNGDAALDVNN